jgi:hypothetical protein
MSISLVSSSKPFPEYQAAPSLHTSQRSERQPCDMFTLSARAFLVLSDFIAKNLEAHLAEEKSKEALEYEAQQVLDIVNLIEDPTHRNNTLRNLTLECIAKEQSEYAFIFLEECDETFMLCEFRTLFSQLKRLGGNDTAQVIDEIIRKNISELNLTPDQQAFVLKND